MSIKCKGICDELKKQYKQYRCYIGNNKKCNTCDFWIQTDEIRCQCCNQILRVSVRKKKRIKPCLDTFGIDHIGKNSLNGMIKRSIYLTPELEEIVQLHSMNLSKYVITSLSKDYGVTN